MIPREPAFCTRSSLADRLGLPTDRYDGMIAIDFSHPSTVDAPEQPLSFGAMPGSGIECEEVSVAPTERSRANCQFSREQPLAIDEKQQPRKGWHPRTWRDLTHLSNPGA